MSALAVALAIAVAPAAPVASVATAAPETPTAPGVGVMAYNVLDEGADDDATLALITAESPDVLCLEELTPKLAKRVEATLGAAYPHRSLAPKVGTWGIGILAKKPLEHVAVFAQQPYAMPGIEADVDGVRYACVHLFPPGAKRFAGDDLGTTMKKNAALRVDQARALVVREKARADVVIMGDFNEGSDDAAVRVFLDAGYAVAPSGGTWPGATSPFPAMFAIDHVVVRGLTVQSARVVRGGGSDHFPVAAVLAKPGP